MRTSISKILGIPNYNEDFTIINSVTGEKIGDFYVDNYEILRDANTDEAANGTIVCRIITGVYEAGPESFLTDDERQFIARLGPKAKYLTRDSDSPFVYVWENMPKYHCVDYKDDDSQSRPNVIFMRERDYIAFVPAETLPSVKPGSAIKV